MIEKEVYGWIYGLQSPSGKWYIGQTTSVNPLEYIKDNYKYRNGKGRRKLKAALAKYGFDSFRVLILDKQYDQISLDDSEVMHIKIFNTLGKNGYNIHPGGKNRKHSQETIERMRKVQKGRIITEEHKKNISNSRITNGVSKGSKNPRALIRTIMNIETKERYTGCLAELSISLSFNPKVIVRSGYSKGYTLIKEDGSYILPKPQVAWNKGLTIDDARVRKYIQSKINNRADKTASSQERETK